ncbi:alpha/beta hydrolase [Salinimicrobium gaetbulicola]|uniref:Alpha/beta hydrolase n=1 Tax=Salinimicrobium gaetbulicola TaxID=999702 RepID=A0ABW3IF19_9FLAO
MKNSIFVLLFLVTSITFGQNNQLSSEDIKINKFVEGTLLKPTTQERPPLIIMIQGSGPIDRNGNQSFMKSDYFKKLAYELAEKGIASYRYDKRILRASQLGLQEKDIRFDDFISDASSVLAHFKNDSTFSKLVVLGHSQGSLVGMVAAKDAADAYISIAGPSQPIDSVITQQIAKQVPGLKENVQTSFKEIRETGSSNSYNPVLETVFRPNLQPFMLSWMQYDPRKEIADLEIPVLIINGNKDLQIGEESAQELKDANPDAELVIIDKMNHVLRKIEGSDLENSKSYNEPGNPIHAELVSTLVKFIKSIDEL